MTAAADKGWSLGDDDRTLLRELIAALRRLLPLAKSNGALIALGDVLDAIEKVRDGAGVEESAALSVGFQGGDEEFKEGWFVRVGIGPDAIVLDKLATTYSPEIGADRFTTGYAVLKPGGGFDGPSVEAWLAELDDMRQWNAAEIHAQRDPA